MAFPFLKMDGPSGMVPARSPVGTKVVSAELTVEPSLTVGEE